MRTGSSPKQTQLSIKLSIMQNVYKDSRLMWVHSFVARPENVHCTSLKEDDSKGRKVTCYIKGEERSFQKQPFIDLSQSWAFTKEPEAARYLKTLLFVLSADHHMTLLNQGGEAAQDQKQHPRRVSSPQTSNWKTPCTKNQTDFMFCPCCSCCFRLDRMTIQRHWCLCSRPFPFTSTGTSTLWPSTSTGCRTLNHGMSCRDTLSGRSVHFSVTHL